MLSLIATCYRVLGLGLHPAPPPPPNWYLFRLHVFTKLLQHACIQYIYNIHVYTMYITCMFMQLYVCWYAVFCVILHFVVLNIVSDLCGSKVTLQFVCRRERESGNRSYIVSIHAYYEQIAVYIYIYIQYNVMIVYTYIHMHIFTCTCIYITCTHRYVQMQRSSPSSQPSPLTTSTTSQTQDGGLGGRGCLLAEYYTCFNER